MKLCSENIKIFTGDDKTSMGDIIDGFSGNISVTANVAPKMMHEMCQFAATGDTAKASELNNKLDILHDSLFCESNPNTCKVVFAQNGSYQKRNKIAINMDGRKI